MMLRREIDWDFWADDIPPCPVCAQKWRGAPEVFVSVEHGIALMGGLAFQVSELQARLLEVLRAASLRWQQPDEMMDRAYSDLPDCDKPTNVGAVSSAVVALRRKMAKTGWTIESRTGYGYRLNAEGKKRGHAKRKPQQRANSGRTGGNARNGKTVSRRSKEASAGGRKGTRGTRARSGAA